MNALKTLKTNQNGMALALVAVVSIPVVAIAYRILRDAKSAEVKFGDISISYKA